jgi:hypothetical protein
MDRLLWSWERAVPVDDVAASMGLTAAHVERAYRDIEGKRRVAARGLADARLVEPIDLGAR